MTCLLIILRCMPIRSAYIEQNGLRISPLSPLFKRSLLRNRWNLLWYHIDTIFNTKDNTINKLFLSSNFNAKVYSIIEYKTIINHEYLIIIIYIVWQLLYTMIKYHDSIWTASWSIYTMINNFCYNNLIKQLQTYNLRRNIVTGRVALLEVTHGSEKRW